MSKYILSIEHVDTKNGTIRHEYEIPLDGVIDEDVAIDHAKKLKRCLKNSYVVSVSKIERWHIGYITKGSDC